MMTYTVTATLVGEEVFEVNVEVKEGEEVVLTGQTHVCVATEAEATDYAERVFLPDLRNNMKKLSGLVLTWEQTGEGESL